MIGILVHLIGFVTPKHMQQWAEAMRAEIAHTTNSREAFHYALGCLFAALRFRLTVEASHFDNCVLDNGSAKTSLAIPIAGGLGAVAIGIIYLLAADAPSFMITANIAAVLIGLILLATLQWTTQLTPRLATVFAVSGALILIGTALFGNSMEGASRWIKAGPMFVQTSLLLLPLIVILYAKISNVWTLLAIIVSAAAMAIQPDRAMAGAIFAAISVLAVFRRTRQNIAACFVTGVAFLATLAQADHLLAVPYVDHILWTSFDVHPGLGMAMWFGIGLLFLPVLLSRSLRSAPEILVFAACYAAIIGAAAMGAYPTPIVGYGGSAIVGYFLSLTALRRVSLNSDARETERREQPPGSKHRPLEMSLPQ